MRLRNILIVVEDIEKSKKFYHDLFGLDVILDNEGNVVLTEGLVLQEKTIWKNFLERISFQRVIPVSYILRRRISKLLSKNWISFIRI